MQPPQKTLSREEGLAKATKLTKPEARKQKAMGKARGVKMDW